MQYRLASVKVSPRSGSSGIDNDVQRLRRHSDFNGRGAHVLAIGIDVEGCLSFHLKAIGLKILHFADMQVAAEIDGGKETEQLEAIQASDDTRIEAMARQASGVDVDL